MGRREKHVWRGRVWKGIFAAEQPRLQVQIAGLQKTDGSVCTTPYLYMQVDGKGRGWRVRKRGDGDIYAVFRSIGATKCNEWRDKLLLTESCDDVHACTYSALVWASIRLVFSTITWMKTSPTWLSLTKSIKHGAMYDRKFLPWSGSFIELNEKIFNNIVEFINIVFFIIT